MSPGHARDGMRDGPEELALVEDGTADLIAFGQLFLANPDLPARLAAGGPFNPADPAAFYGGDAAGYTDYPALSARRPAPSEGPPAPGHPAKDAPPRSRPVPGLASRSGCQRLPDPALLPERRGVG